MVANANLSGLISSLLPARARRLKSLEVWESQKCAGAQECGSQPPAKVGKDRSLYINLTVASRLQWLYINSCVYNRLGRNEKE